MLRFSCEKALLQSAVNTVSRAVAAKSSIPALEGILVEGSDRLTMSGYNMQTGIRTAFEAEVHEEGRIVLTPACSVRSSGSCRTIWWCLRRMRNIWCA